MSTILKALRRLEEDQPRSADAAETGQTSAALDASTPGDATLAADAGTEALRERILAEERANQPAASTSTSTSTDPAASLASPEVDVTTAPARVDTLRRFASVGALALVVFVLGAVVVPALFDEPAPAGDVATEGPAAIRETASGVAAVAPAPAAAPVERPAPTRGEGSAPVAGRAPTIPARPADEARVAGGAEDLSRRVSPPEPARPARNGSVAVSALPVAPASRAQPSPRPAPAPSPVAPQAAPPPPAREPPVELALVEPTRTPPSAAESSAAPPRAEETAAPAPKPAPRARPAAPPKRPAESIGSTDRPVARTADAKPIERVARPDVPDVSVVRTSWHPDPNRRSARVRVEASGDVLTLEEGDAVGALVIKEISPSAVLFEAGEVEVRRRVGAGS